MKNLSFEKEEDSEFETNRFNPARSGEGECVDHREWLTLIASIFKNISFEKWDSRVKI